jgi:hypothetical protein
VSIVKSNPNAETEGIAPKVAWPTVALIGLGIILAVLDGLGVIDIQDEIWITMLGGGVGTGIIGNRAPASLQKAKTTP